MQTPEKSVHPKLRTVQNLLAKADNPATPGPEAEVCRAKAEQVLLAYGLDMAEVAALKDPAMREEMIYKRIELEGAYSRDRVHLLHRIAVTFRCNGLRERGKQGVYIIYGYESDVARTEFLFASLSLQMQREGARTPAPYGVARVTFLKSFYSGFSSRIAERLREAERRIVEERPAGTALALVDRKEQVADFMASMNPHMTKSYRRVSTVAHGHGREAANRADIGQTRVGGNSRRALGR